MNLWLKTIKKIQYCKMEDQKIYIKCIDGITTFEPMNAIEIGPEKFLVLPDNNFDFTDTSCLYQFHPGDIVSVEDQFSEEYQYTATSLIQLSNHPQRKYWHFIYQTTNYINNLPREEYLAEIRQIKKELSIGIFHYRGVRESVKLIKE